MIYNKTKRGLEKASGIVGVVVSILDIILGLALFIMGIIGLFGGYGTYNFTYEKDKNTANLVLGIIILITSILALIFSSLVITKPIRKDGSIKNRTSTMVCALIFNFLISNIVTFGLLIAVLCLEDFVEKNNVTDVTTTNNVTTDLRDNRSFTINLSERQAAQELVSNLVEVKHLHKISVIDDVNYKKTIQKLINEFISEK